MKFAFCLQKYFPFGGQQRDFLKIARVCMSRGHRVDVYTSSWTGSIPEGLIVTILPIRGFTNHHHRESLAENYIQTARPLKYDALVGFVKIPGLDVYFAADSCFASKAYKKHYLYRITPRYQSYLKMETAVFDKSSKTEILLLSEKEKSEYIKYYQTPEERFHLLPPGISRDRLKPRGKDKIRNDFFREFSIGNQENIVLLIGSGFKTKGVDRAIIAMSALPDDLKKNTRLLIVGKDKPGPFLRLARRLAVSDQIRFIGGREDISRFLASADLLIHPAYRENTGTVLIEAMASQLPVLVTDVCGYSHYVENAGAGIVLTSPFDQKSLNKNLEIMLTSSEAKKWRLNGGKFVENTDVFGLAEKASDIIEKVAKC